jgi:hypothetical protein
VRSVDGAFSLKREEGEETWREICTSWCGWGGGNGRVQGRGRKELEMTMVITMIGRMEMAGDVSDLMVTCKKMALLLSEVSDSSLHRREGQRSFLCTSGAPLKGGENFTSALRCSTRTEHGEWVAGATKRETR